MTSGCILTQYATGRKHGESLEALGHGFHGSTAKRSLPQNSAKIIQKFAVRPSDQRGGWAVAPSPVPVYATGCKRSFERFVSIVLKNVILCCRMH